MHVRFRAGASDLEPGDYWRLYRLARRRLSSKASYQEFQSFQGELLIRFLRSRGIEVAGRLVADIGCGYGGYSRSLSASGARVVGVDLFAEGRPVSSEVGSLAVQADALAAPFGTGTFDLVICASLIEHIAQPELLLAELYRQTRPGGIIYVSFPPYYSPRGGHQFSPYHYLGERRAIALSRRLRVRTSNWVQSTYPDDPESFDTLWGAWGLHVLTIGKFERFLAGSPLLLRERSTRLLPVDFSGLPILREVLTWHVQYLLGKPAKD
jgi:SAM-dependent methyltransferase